MKKAIDIFGEWAEQGKDVGMENTHMSIFHANIFTLFGPFSKYINCFFHSHSIVDGGFEDISNVTLEIPETSLMIRVDT